MDLLDERSKYKPLQVYIANLETDSWNALFEQIEQILRIKLPHSAYKYPAWRGNNVQNSGHTKAWVDIGWETHNLDLSNNTATFCK